MVAKMASTDRNTVVRRALRIGEQAAAVAKQPSLRKADLLSYLIR